ncbi:MAG: hypothetical protein IJ863_08000 [Spirochaetales bacterium]|nr:hypothetical protein [Spirochaetales bacterium]
MKTIARLLIILDFAAIVFIPSKYLPRLALIPMFLLMFGLVVLYWFAMFWVSEKDVNKVLGREPDSQIYVGRLPADPSADLIRGRLCAVDGKLVLLQRNDDKQRRTAPCKEVWSMRIDDVSSVGFGKVLPARKGFILYKGDDAFKFTCAKAARTRASSTGCLIGTFRAETGSEPALVGGIRRG